MEKIIKVAFTEEEVTAITEMALDRKKTVVRIVSGSGLIESEKKRLMQSARMYEVIMQKIKHNS